MPAVQLRVPGGDDDLGVPAHVLQGLHHRGAEQWRVGVLPDVPCGPGHAAAGEAADGPPAERSEGEAVPDESQEAEAGTVDRQPGDVERHEAQGEVAVLARGEGHGGGESGVRQSQDQGPAGHARRQRAEQHRRGA